MGREISKNFIFTLVFGGERNKKNTLFSLPFFRGEKFKKIYIFTPVFFGSRKVTFMMSCYYNQNDTWVKIHLPIGLRVPGTEKRATFFFSL